MNLVQLFVIASAMKTAGTTKVALFTQWAYAITLPYLTVLYEAIPNPWEGSKTNQAQACQAISDTVGPFGFIFMIAWIAVGIILFAAVVVRGLMIGAAVDKPDKLQKARDSFKITILVMIGYMLLQVIFMIVNPGGCFR